MDIKDLKDLMRENNMKKVDRERTKLAGGEGISFIAQAL